MKPFITHYPTSTPALFQVDTLVTSRVIVHYFLITVPAESSLPYVSEIILVQVTFPVMGIIFLIRASS
jgi:hypothetical protein